MTTNTQNQCGIGVVLSYETQKWQNLAISRGFIPFQPQAQPSSYPTRTRSDCLNGDASNELREADFLSAANSGAVEAENGADDPRLVWLIEVWPMLSESTRDAIVKIVGDEVGDVMASRARARETTASS